MKAKIGKVPSLSRNWICSVFITARWSKLGCSWRTTGRREFLPGVTLSMQLTGEVSNEPRGSMRNMEAYVE